MNSFHEQNQKTRVILVVLQHSCILGGGFTNMCTTNRIRAVWLSLIFFVLSTSILTAQTPRFKNYTATFPVMGGDAAEPSIGVNRETGNVMFQAGLETLRISFNDVTSPAMTTWVNTEPLLLSLLSLDPVMYMDPVSNRTLVSQLEAACSLSEYTDDDGETWNLSIGCGIPSGFDHQSVGGGPYAQPAPPNSFPTAMYYCSQNLLTAICSRSDDGGFIFGVGIPVYLLLTCDGRHGRVKVGPDGTVYLPNAACGTKQGLAVSSAGCDPSVSVGANNRVYFGYQNGNGHPRVAISTDKGISWKFDQDVGVDLGIQNIVFPAVVAGDNDRAAFAFLGTTTAGDFQDEQFSGIWYLYVSTTFDGGQTWTTVNVTPNDPVQVGSISIQSGLEPSARRFTTNMSTPLLDRGDRNLLDFIDISMDAKGRILVGYADGCIDDCVQNPSSNLSRSALASIARQSGGKRLLAAFDPVEPAKPTAPLLTGTRDSFGVHLNWSVPDDNGSPITKYVIFRRTDVTRPSRIKKVKIGTAYTDNSVDPNTTYYYYLKAANSIGKSKPGNEVAFVGN
jgi:Fibronectin type III domain